MAEFELFEEKLILRKSACLVTEDEVDLTEVFVNVEVLG